MNHSDALLEQIPAHLRIYVELGIPIFPVKKLEKYPDGSLAPHGVYDATCDPAIILAWCKKGAGPNWGIAAGHKMKDGRHLHTVDIDTYKPGLETDDLDLPPTVEVITPRKGRHLYYGAREPIASNDCVLGRTGLEFKGPGKYTVGVGSSTSHGEYMWEHSSSLEYTRIADLPEWLYGAKPQPRPEFIQSDPINSTIGVAFDRMGWAGSYVNGKRYCTCPWEHEHTENRSASSTALLPITDTSNFGAFKCMHAHCSDRNAMDAFNMCSEEAKNAGKKAFPMMKKVEFVSSEDQEPKPEPPLTVEHYYPTTLLCGKYIKDGFIASGAVANVLALCANGPWEGKIGYDEMADMPVLLSQGPHEEKVSEVYPREWNGNDDTLAAGWLQTSVYKVPVATSTVTEGINAIAKANRFNKLIDYFLSLKWDGVARVDKWLTQYMGADENEYTRQAGRMFLISAIARTFNPGCQADYVLVLVGEQRKGKSTAMLILAGRDYFSDDIGDISTKDAAERLRGKLINEIAELARSRNKDDSTTKSFLTRREDNYREAYGRRAGRFPRRGIFVGTINEKKFLSDSTGGGRYWPVQVDNIDLEALARDRDQLWAEALVMFRAGIKWYPDNQSFRDAAAEQAEIRRNSDPWEDVLKEVINKESVISLTLSSAFDMIGIPASNRDSKQQTRISKALQVLGFSPGADGVWIRS